MKKLSVIVLALCLTPTLAAQQSPELPFRLIDGWAIIVEGTLGGIPHQKLLIDTGAVPSAINLNLARRLGLSGSSQKISAVSRSVNVESVRVPGVQVGAVEADTLDMIGIDLSGIEQRLDTCIDAIIGLDVLARRNFSLDYRRKRLIFGNSASSSASIPFETRHEAGGTYIVISLESNGERLQMLLDTGTKDMTLFERRLGGRLRLLRVRGQESNLTAAGWDRIIEVEMDTVNVGPVSRRKQKAYVLNGSENELRDFDGLLGPAALGATSVAFDFNRGVVSFETR